MTRFPCLVACALAVFIATTACAKELGARFSTDVPFFDCDGLICIDVALDRAKPRRMLLDTGNINHVFVAESAREAGWALEPLQKDGAAVPGIYRAGEHWVGIGKVEATAAFFAFDRAQLGQYPPPGDGAITYPFFKDRVVQIDYPAHRLRISDIVTTPLADRDESQGVLKLITFGEHGPPVLVASPFTLGGKNVRAQIDTCYTGGLLIYDAALDQLGLARQGKSEFFRYTDGGVNMLASRTSAIGFGRHEIAKDATVYVVGEGAVPVHQPDGLFEGTVGNALFAHSVVTMDFHAMTMDVKPGG
jgi:hypothetical protein